jgi:hypothetical protein
MCFEFASCFGNSRTEDYGGEWSASKTQHGRGRRVDRRNGAYYGGASDNKTRLPGTYHRQPTPAINEAGHKAYHDSVRKADHTEVSNHVGYGPYSHDKANNKVDDAGYIYTYTARPHEAAADRWQNAAMGYHQYPTTTANTTTLVRY